MQMENETIVTKEKKLLGLIDYCKLANCSLSSVYNRVWAGEIKLAEETGQRGKKLIDANEYPPEKFTLKSRGVAKGTKRKNKEIADNPTL